MFFDKRITTSTSQIGVFEFEICVEAKKIFNPSTAHKKTP